MRIAVVQSSCPTPSEIFVYSQAVALSRMGHDVSLFGYRSKAADSALRHWFHNEIGLPVVHPWRVPPTQFGCKALADLQGALLPHFKTELKRTKDTGKFGWWADTRHLHFWACTFARQQPFDVIHAHFAPIGAIVAMLKECEVLKSPLVVSLHGADVTSKESEAHVDSGLYPWLWKHADQYTYNSSFIRERAVHMGFPEDKMTRLPVAIGKQFEQGIKSVKRSESQSFRVISVGRLVHKKGHITGLKAFKAFLSTCPQACYELIGDGPLRSQVEEFIKDHDLESNVRLMGAMTQSQVRKSMLSADVFLFPSETAPNGDMEGQGLVVQEAQACGLPVIITRHNGVPDGVLVGKTGLMAEEKDWEKMAEYLAELYRDPTRAAQMGERGRKFVIDRYTSGELAQRLSQILEGAMA